MNSTLTLIVAGVSGLITFLAARRIFRNQFQIGPPNLLAACVAGLAFLGLATIGEGLVVALLIPYAALAIALVILLLLAWIARLLKIRPGRGRSRGGGINCNPKSSSSSRIGLRLPLDRLDPRPLRAAVGKHKQPAPSGGLSREDSFRRSSRDCASRSHLH